MAVSRAFGQASWPWPRTSGPPRPLPVTLVSRAPYLTIRPRLYEADPKGFRSPLAPLLAMVGVRLVEAEIAGIDVAGRSVDLAGTAPLAYDRLVLAAPRNDLGRLVVDDMLRFPAHAEIFATGDIASARVDEASHRALMSCQHAMTMGRYAGHNAGRDLLGLPLEAYRQERYVTCLDLGPAGAVFTRGWNREVEITGVEAKAYKRKINGEIIYPPSGTRAEILALATPGAGPSSQTARRRPRR